jgi:hypothetical protein
MLHNFVRAPSRASARWITLILLSTGIYSCGEEESTQQAESVATVKEDLAPADIDLSALRGLGYTDFSEEEDWSTVDGLVIHDPSRASEGYTFYVDIPTARAFLLDMRGAERATWSLPGARQWNRGIILEDGDLLAIGVSDKEALASMPRVDGDVPMAGFLARMSWSGEVLWRKQIGAHHDIELTQDGHILVLGEARRLTELHPDCGIIDNAVMLFTGDGELVDEVSSYDVLNSTPEVNQFVERRNEEKCSLGYPNDCLHLNCGRWIDQPNLTGRHAIYEPGNVIITSRKQHTVAIFNFERRELIWAWGRGTILFPHEAQVLDNGHILLLDNGAPNKREYSRVIELDPIENKIVWSYSATPPESFYTIGRGTVQRLPNDNILISSSGQGQIFEVARDGDVVWRYHNPYFSGENNAKKRGVLRAQRYTSEFIDNLLATTATIKPAKPQDGR